ncbi:hypothetical protein SAMN05660293_03019 [Dyadobacter psychrophilus]|uniref:HicA toxin of toxin-antitoxin n=1 Tax=Dyadobacter psychrophilus TaxID=651661 RepID=A0A1T5FBX5_9BACT|nr:hypothetical protein SAMN05660293_03019 [Dyadobacter psychrophilus]
MNLLASLDIITEYHTLQLIRNMGKFDKLMLKLLSGSADSNFSFDDLRLILINLGFTEKTTGGSHRIFYK